uniref:Uncharacterized protein n=1 Tax=Timema genevievae TaxID=629358 RepID=A0A7R9PH14_TIMGE|nr:unnamed protein product [Timema genevievae]
MRKRNRVSTCRGWQPDIRKDREEGTKKTCDSSSNGRAYGRQKPHQGHLNDIAYILGLEAIEAKKSGNIAGSGIESYFNDIDRVMMNRSNKTAVFSESTPKSRPISDPLATTKSFINQHSDQNKDMVQTTCIKSEAPSPQSSDESVQEIQETSNDSAYYKQYFEPTNAVLDENSSSNHTPSAVVHRLVPSVETNRERQTRIEVKLDQILDKIETLVSISNVNHGKRVTPGTSSDRDQESRMMRLLNRLEWALPMMAQSLSPSHQQSPTRPDTESRMNILLGKLEQILPQQQSSSCSLHVHTANHRAMMNETVEKERSPPDKLSVACTACLFPGATFMVRVSRSNGHDYDIIIPKHVGEN